MTEFIEIAGARMGADAAMMRIMRFKERGMQIMELDEENVQVAGNLLLSHRNVPIADALIAPFVITGAAEYVVTGDSNFKTLSVKPKWL